MDEDFRKAALDYHRLPRPGKLAIEATKRMATQRDLALAYSPGVAAPCIAIAENPELARDYTARGNLVAVISNGTAVLGLGDIGPLASKPVMEGKAVLFKKFAGIDVFDIEVDAKDPDRFIEVVAALEPTFGGINLEDIKAPECFVIERKLRERMNIPVFHDDQHGTAIVCAAAVRNALLVQGKQLKDVKLVTSGAGAAALACVDLLVSMGLPVENVTLTDIKGVVHAGREPDMPDNMARYARQTDARTLPEVLPGADIFLGLSAPRVFKPEWLPLLAPNPLILAMANPEPEILPELVYESRPDAIMATGRSDYANQVNNVLCFPFIFRGALDVGASEINEAMKVAAVEAIAELARAEASEVVASAYGGAAPVFGSQYIIPKPFDPRLILQIAPAVAKAAMDSGVATRPIADFDAYQAELELFVYRSGQLMRPVFERARKQPVKVAYAEAEDERVLRAVQTVVDEGLAYPVLVGRREVITGKIEELGLRLAGKVEIIDPQADKDLFAPLIADYQRLVGRRGVPPIAAERRVTGRRTVAASMLLATGYVEAALVGGSGDWWQHMKYALPIIPRRDNVSRVYAMSSLILDKGTLFFCDTHVNVDPTAEQIAECTQLAAEAVRRFGLTPKAALLSHSSFGASDSPTARKMREALALLRTQAPDLEVDGEMHADAALSQHLRDRMVADSPLKGSANLLVMPTLDAANIGLTLLSAATESLLVGPVLLGMAKPLHVLIPSVTARGIVNLTALAVNQAVSERAAS
ncbi:NADP-dependent malic enzyme [Caulobacter vibrioides]|uniref:NADP-dependent malic enzyme n=2 Tax=Caulobacter vibrioides TaxID=155892 RepID=Q9A543_CAUVC|nr:NADP-dependent malic enzyme [Caulobacter vibrioides]YP_002518077.1 NADP-dependent malic enzyme [Caulobacter vibrioides NA1000]QBQ57301.1 NADP-dependent malic enzyme [synthetic Caulobacter sp. 'ethensis']AAK24590.1 NADP-dependent malic enzyme [Caulobacter vibrioides CB15]ACL96169.1 NADP-dependent malic enzyme [Caulobacter vibrioides NA1000]ATC29465.1 NADP-dependent malic enzyme [Caulobacter vibrioides]QXZ50984.1 NADP-dependent malic enzyme [Caulobacter vibrioides]